MTDETGGPVLAPTLAEWLRAREETLRHVESGAVPVDREWVQHLANLLATERSWQDQYTELIALGRKGGSFPPSQR